MLTDSEQRLAFHVPQVYRVVGSVDEALQAVGVTTR
jgi:hypothetical protein